MKKIILFFLLVLSKVAFAQNVQNKIVYLDSLHFETNPNNYIYYRIVKDYYVNKKEYKFTQYYSSDKIESIGNSTNKDFYIKNGEVVSYYENGNLKSKINYSENQQSGNCSFWYENGNKKLEGEFILTKENDVFNSKLKLMNFWDADNNQKVIDGFGEYIIEENDFKSVSTANGKIEKGFKVGIWKGSSKTFNFTFEENYENGNLIEGASIDKNNVKYNYTKIQIPPEIKGGMIVFYSFIRNNFKAPDIPGLKGKVVTSFVINENGDINDLKTIRSLEPNVDKEAIRVLKKFKNFTPAVLRGIKVNCYYILPITVETPNE